MAFFYLAIKFIFMTAFYLLNTGVYMASVHFLESMETLHNQYADQILPITDKDRTALKIVKIALGIFLLPFILFKSCWNKYNAFCENRKIQARERTVENLVRFVGEQNREGVLRLYTRNPRVFDPQGRIPYALQILHLLRKADEKDKSFLNPTLSPAGHDFIEGPPIFEGPYKEALHRLLGYLPEM